MQQRHGAHAGLSGAQSFERTFVADFPGLQLQQAGDDLQVIFDSVVDFAQQGLYFVVFAGQFGVGVLQYGVVAFSGYGIPIQGKSERPE